MRHVARLKCWLVTLYHLNEREQKHLCLYFTSSFTLGDHQACDWHLTRPRRMQDLAAFSAKNVISTATQGRERKKCFSARQ